MKMMNEWKKYPDNKPTKDGECICYNRKMATHTWHCRYFTTEDVFYPKEKGFFIHMPLEVTDFIEVPYPPFE